MDERRKTYLRLIAEICIAIVSVVAVALLGGPVVGILLPFILAFIMAWMFNPVIAWLQRRHAADAQAVLRIFWCWCFTRCCSVMCLFFAGQLVSQAIDLARSVPTFIAQIRRGCTTSWSRGWKRCSTKLPAEYAGVGDELFSLLGKRVGNGSKTLLSGALSYAMSITRNIALEVPTSSSS